MTTRTLLSTLAACWALLALACADGSGQGALATDEPRPPDVKPVSWNQERVTAIAIELADAAAGLRAAVRDNPVGSTIGSGQETAQYRLLEKLKVLRNESRHLATSLKGGAGREATLPVYERIGTLARDAREEARKIFLPEPVMASITRAGDVWRRLTPYYVGV